MHPSLLLGCLVLAADYFLASAYMIPDDRLFTNRVVVSNALPYSPPPVLIVELPKVKKNKKGKKQRKDKFGVKKRPPPPADCIPLWGSCKSPTNVCCDFCAFCQCRLFRTVCICRMGNPLC
ncbi:agouti signaling protein 1 [Sebastes fasciatus]|uniref:agouti signaling protein 1 n=1 Tax=Sebastes fasciatus TaxID=394691 RepID=UPI003D9DB7A7